MAKYTPAVIAVKSFRKGNATYVACYMGMYFL